MGEQGGGGYSSQKKYVVQGQGAKRDHGVIENMSSPVEL